MSHILLIGFMGAGKSSAGKLAADALGMPFIDLDARLEARAGKSVADIFADDGEQAFRDLEHAELAALASEPDSIVACGGGVVVRDDNRALMPALGTVVYLRVSAGEALARIGDTASRPLLAGEAAPLAATRLLDAREALYRAVADVIIETEGREVAQVADELVQRVRAVAGDA